MHDFDSIYFAGLIWFSGHGARACSAGVGQQTGSRQSACRPISCAVTSAIIFVCRVAASHARRWLWGGSCAVMAEIQTTQPSNRFEHRVRGLLPNWTRALRPKFLLGTSGLLLGTSGSIFERRMISPRRRFGAMEHKMLPEVPKGRKSRFGNAHLLARFSGWHKVLPPQWPSS